MAVGQRSPAGYQVAVFMTNGLELPHAANALEVANQRARGQVHPDDLVADGFEMEGGHAGPF